MARQIQLRRGTTAEHSTFTGAVGEVTVDTDKDVVVVHDGATAGGYPMVKATSLDNYATAAQGALADTAVQPNDDPTFGTVTVTGTVDGRDIASDGSKLDGIAAGAEVNTVDSVNTQTGAVVLDADDISDATTTNKFTTAGDISKLAGIEAGADVTDAGNVNPLVDSHLNTGTATSGEYLSWNGSDYDWATVPAGYTNSDVDTHLNIGTAATGEYLSWTGSDYDWVAVEAFDTQTATTTSTTEAAIATYATASYDAAKVVVTADDGTDRTVSELLITWKSTTAYATEYAIVNTGASALATYDVDVSGGNFRILATAASSTSTSYTVKAITL